MSIVSRCFVPAIVRLSYSIKISRTAGQVNTLPFFPCREIDRGRIFLLLLLPDLGKKIDSGQFFQGAVCPENVNNENEKQKWLS